MERTSDAYAELKKTFEATGSKAQVFLPGDGEAYAKSIVRWSEHCVKEASCVVKVSNADDVTATLKFVRAHKIPFVVKGGGHSTSGSASIQDGLVIDLGLMRKVTVDEEKMEIKAEGGTIWEDVDVEAAKYGLATVGGTVNHTGVGGLTLGGGYGYLSGKYGLTIDNLLSVDIVLASGEQVVASPTSHSDLFWAVRGAGQNFGVTTSFTFRAHRQTNPVYAGPLIFTPDKLPEIVAFLNKFHTTTDGNQALLMGFTAPPPANASVVLTMLFHNGTEDEGNAIFKDLIAVGPVANLVSMIPYTQLNSLLNPSAGFDGRKMFGGGAYKLPLDPTFVQSLFQDFNDFVGRHERMNESLMLWETVPYREVIKVRNDEMAFANRGEYYNLATLFKWFDPSLDNEVREFARGLLKKASQSAGVVQDEKIRATEGVGQYGNYANADVPANEIYGSNAKRLEELKHKYDPDNLFDRGTRLVPKPLVVVN